jgi:hypothetical protein
LSLSALCAVLGYLYWRYNFDDVFIGYRIAENLAHGEGWIYNPGERVNGATSVLWILVQAAAVYLGTPPSFAAHLAAPAALLLSGLLLWTILKPCYEPATAYLGVIAFVTFPLLTRAWGMETQLYLMCALLAVWAHLQRNDAALGLALGALLLTRPDGLLLAVLLLTRSWAASRRLPWLSIALAAALVLPWALFSLTYFGQPFPNTLAAKMAQARSGLWDLRSPWPFSWLPMFVQGLLFWFKRIYNPLLMALATPFLLAGLNALPRWSPVERLLTAWGAIHLIAYSTLKVPHYHWYYAPVVVAFVVVLTRGGDVVWAWARGRGGYVRPILVGTVAGMIVLTNLVHVYLDTRALPTPPEQVYRAVGEFLKEHTETGAQVASAEIGVIGYYSHRPMVDMAGLIEPSGPDYLRRGDRGWWLRVRSPDVVVTHVPLWRLEQPISERRDYEVWRTFETPGYGVLRVYRRTGG